MKPRMAAPAAPNPGQVEELERARIAAETCTACSLHHQRTHSVLGIGHANAEMMWVGEAPGPDEDIQGAPFTGRSGELLDRIVEALGARREEVFLGNTVSCRLDEARRLTREQTEACRHFLEAQIDAVGPRVIVALGATAWTWFKRGDKRPMAEVRGRVHRWRGIYLVPTYHPAFLLRMPQYKADVWADVQVAKALAEGGEREAAFIDETAEADTTDSLFD